MMLQDLPADHDLSHLDEALRHVREFRCAVDGGAHRGIWTRALAQRFVHVIAIEPCAENFVHLDPKTALCVHAALGAEPGRTSMAPGPENTGQWHLVTGDEVDVLAVDEFRLSVCDFLKLDVEGYELHALQGARATLLRCRPTVLIEENGLCARYGIEPGASAAFLVGLGMRQVARCNKDLIFVWG